MQNTNFVYHPESLLEMQIIITIVVIYLGTYENVRTKFIMYFLLSEHCFSYIVAYYRSWDIEMNGQLDINGIKRAPGESFVGNIQFFIGCILIGFTINHFVDPENQKTFIADNMVLQNYWIIIDMMIVFLS